MSTLPAGNNNGTDRPRPNDLIESDQLTRAYIAMLGEVPPHARHRWSLLAAAGRARTVEAMEGLRGLVISESALDLRTQQMVQFGQLLMLRAEGPARLHARSALRLGATIPELMAVAETAYLAGGVTCFSLGVEIVGELMEQSSTESSTGSDHTPRPPG